MFNFINKGVAIVKGAVSKTVDFCVEQKDKALVALGLGATVGVSTPAKADLATDLGTVTTAATTGLSTVSSSQATVIAAVFGLVLLAVGAKWIFGSIKAR